MTQNWSTKPLVSPTKNLAEYLPLKVFVVCKIYSIAPYFKALIPKFTASSLAPFVLYFYDL